MDFRNTSKRSSKGAAPKFSVPLELMAMRSSKIQELDVSAMTARAMTANWWRTKLISLAGGTGLLACRANRNSRSCVVDPDFRGDQVYCEAEPESCAKEIMRRQMGNASGGEKHAGDGPDSGHGQSNSERPNHRFPVLRHLSPTHRHDAFVH